MIMSQAFTRGILTSWCLLLKLTSFMARIKPQALLQQSKKKKLPSRISVTTLVLYGLIALVMVFFLFATFRHWTRRSTTHSEDGLPNLTHEDAFVGSSSDVPRFAVRLSLYVFHVLKIWFSTPRKVQ